MADKQSKSLAQWFFDLLNLWSLYDRAKSVWDAMPAADHVVAGGICLIAPIAAAAVSVVNEIQVEWVIVIFLLTLLTTAYFTFAWYARKFQLAAPQEPPPVPQTIAPGHKPPPPPKTLARPVSLRWTDGPRAKALHVLLTNETLAPVNHFGLRVKDLRPWAKGAFVKDDNNPQIADIFAGDTLNTLDPRTEPIVFDWGDHFKVRGTTKWLSGSRETIWKIVLQVSTAETSYEVPPLFFRWGPGLSTADNPEQLEE